MQDLATKYHELRRKHPLLSASTILRWAKQPDHAEQWEPGGNHPTSDGWGSNFVREVDCFTVTLTVEVESTFPVDGDCLGHYVEAENYSVGPENKPVEETPLNLPPKIFASVSYYNADRGAYPYFFPDNVDDFYERRRKDGASKSVAWMDTYEMVEETIASFFGGPLVNAYLKVTASKAGVELGESGIGTDYIDDYEGAKYVFMCVEEHGLVNEAISEAKAKLDALATA